MERKIIKTVQGRRTKDGAGVSLVRVLSAGDMKAFDPFLMLDSFDSSDPKDYVLGFPMHPHRGIETLTYLIAGRIDHRDSLGNKGSIHSGGSQWMTAGSGIMHEEMPKESESMLGFQLWINLPKEEKMTEPAYNGLQIAPEDIVREGAAEIRIVAGEYKGRQTAFVPKHVQARVYDVSLEAKAELGIPTKPDTTVFIFTIVGELVAGETLVPEKTAALSGEGDVLRIRAEKPARFIYFEGKPLREEIAWGGPIVMNTQAELEMAFRELEEGRFIKGESQHL